MRRMPLFERLEDWRLVLRLEMGLRVRRFQVAGPHLKVGGCPHRC